MQCEIDAYLSLMVRITSNLLVFTTVSKKLTTRYSFFFSVNFNTRPVGHWTGKNMRLLMMNVAKSRNLDPLVPETWYSISSNEILKYKV